MVTAVTTLFPTFADMDAAAPDQFFLHLHENSARDDGLVGYKGTSGCVETISKFVSNSTYYAKNGVYMVKHWLPKKSKHVKRLK